MCQACTSGLSRRDFLKLSSLFSLAGSLPLLSQLEKAHAADPNAPLRIGYLPITDAAPLLVAHHQGLFAQQGIEVEQPRLFRSWAQLVEAFLSGGVNLVHLLSPMAVWARYSSLAPTKTVAWNHINGSSLTTALAPKVNSFADLGGTSFALPFWYSVHNIIFQLLLKKEGLEPILSGTPTAKQVKLLVMAPADMLPALANGSISGYLVAEPFNAAAEVNKVGKVLRFSGDVWQNHACCLVQMHEQDLASRPEWSQKVVNALVEAQLFIRNNPAETAKILASSNSAKYTPHSQAILEKVLVPSSDFNSSYQATGAIQNTDWQQQRIDFQPYPYPSYTEKLVELLKTTQVRGDNGFLAKLEPSFVAQDLVDDRFVKQAIEKLGGMQRFGQAGYSRQEVLAP